MAARAKAIGIILVVALFALAGCTSQAASSGSGSSASSTSGAASSSSGTTVLDAEDAVEITLDYNAGTGYQWVYAMDPEGVVSESNKNTNNKAENSAVAGGPLSDVYTFRAVAPGEVVLTFKLVRNWEDSDPAETQIYAFTVSKDLKMTLNPYKSDFKNEPVWLESNS